MNYFECPIRIRYAETDQMGVSYYGNYFTWFEAARNEYFRELGLPYTRYEKEGIYLPVGEAYCRYSKPSRYDDLIYVRTWISVLKRSSIKFCYHICDETKEAILAEGHTTHFFVDRHMKPCRIPASIKEKVVLWDGEERK